MGGAIMVVSEETLEKRRQHTAETYEKKAKREWARAKNNVDDNPGKHYHDAKICYERAKRTRDSGKK